MTGLIKPEERNLLIPAVWKPRMFDSLIIPRWYPEGTTVLEIIQSFDDLPDHFLTHGEVLINGHKIDRRYWHLVRPRLGKGFETVVTLHLAPLGPQGGGGGRNNTGKMVIAIVAAIALTIATAGVGAGALQPILGAAFAAGTFGAQAAAAGLGLAGSLLIKALIPPPSLNLAQQPSAAFTTPENKNSGIASLSGNVLRPGGPIPRPVGSVRIYPPFLCQALVEIVGDDEIAEVCLGIAGPNAISDLRAGTTPFDDIQEVDYEVQEGWWYSPPVSLIQRFGKTDTPKIELSHHKVKKDNQQHLENQTDPVRSCPNWHSFFSKPAGYLGFPDEIWATLFFTEGLLDGNNPSSRIGVPTRIRMRLKGTTSWVNLPEIHWRHQRASPFKKDIRILWAAPPAELPTPLVTEAPSVAYIHVAGQIASGGNTVATDGWDADAYFDSGSGDDWVGAEQDGDTNLDTTAAQNIALYDDRVEIYLDEDTFPKGVYEFQIMRGSSYATANFDVTNYNFSGGPSGPMDFFLYWFSTPNYVTAIDRSNVHDSIQIARVASVWNQHPIQTDEVAVIAVKVRNRQLAEINCLAAGYVPDWNGTEWADWKTTDNPAPHLIDVMTGRMTARPIAGEVVDNDEILELRQRAIDMGYRCNAVFEGRSMADAMRVIANTAYAQPRQSDKWGVVIDKDTSEEGVVQVFSQRTVQGFAWSKGFPDIPTGIRTTHSNAERDYKEKEIIVYNPIFPEPDSRKLESIRYDGFDSDEEVIARAYYDMAQITERGMLYSWTSDVEYIACKRGSLIGLQHDVFSEYAGSGYIKEVVRDTNVILGFDLDGSIPILRSGFFTDAESGEDFFDDTATDEDFFADARIGVAVRLNNETVITREIETVEETETKEIRFLTPLPDPGTVSVNGETVDAFSADCLVVSGELEEIFSRCRILSIMPKTDLTAAIVAVDEAPRLWADT